MNAVVPFAFDDSLVRAVWCDDDPWFVAADICRALALSNPSMTIKALDEDERAKLNLGRQGETTIVSEGGLYTLILRCRDATKPGTVPHRFRRWVTGEVLPTLRRTGRYGAPPASAEREQEAVVREREWRLETVAEARRIYGAERARHLWERLGLPEVPPLPDDTASPTPDILERKFLGDVVARKLQSIAEAYGTWTGTAAQLLAEMNADAYPMDLQNRRWPRTSQALGIALTRVRPLLLHRGIRVERRHSGNRTITLVMAEIGA